jgi:hypothetical protein
MTQHVIGLLAIRQVLRAAFGIDDRAFGKAGVAGSPKNRPK